MKYTVGRHRNEILKDKKRISFGDVVEDLNAYDTECNDLKLTLRKLETRMRMFELHQLNKIELLGTINSFDKTLLPGEHFCPDWDDMAIFNESPEKSSCNCGEI